MSCSKSTSYSVTIVIPALNEEMNIAAAIERSRDCIQSLHLDGEIIVVNDGSRDGTLSIAQHLQSQYPNLIRIIDHATPRGIGQSFWEASQMATKELITLNPGDNENDPAQIFNYLPITREVDLVIPFICNVNIRHYSRRLISSLYRLIVNLSFGTSLNYTNGTVIYRRAILQTVGLKSFGFFFQTELLIKLLRQGYLFAEVPCFLQQRSTGQSKATTIRSLLNVIRAYMILIAEIHIFRSSGWTNTMLAAGSITWQKYNHYEHAN